MKFKEYLRHLGERAYKVIANKTYVNIKQQKDSFKGKSCFIICNGPSLCPKDLDALYDAGIPCFATNRIFNIYSQTKWRPDYVAVFDQGLMYDVNTLKEISANDPKIFFLNSNAAYTARNLDCNLCLLNIDWNKELLKHPRFSENIEDRIYGIGTVTYSCIQIACYMGFTNMYILGADNKYPWTHNQDGSHSFDGDCKSYFSKLDNILNKPAMGATWEMNIAYEFALKMSKKLGFNIYNSTRGGHLNVYKRIAFEKAVERCKEEMKHLEINV